MADTQEGVRLAALDWVVIVAASVSFVILAIWIYQGHNRPPKPPAAS